MPFHFTTDGSSEERPDVGNGIRETGGTQSIQSSPSYHPRSTEGRGLDGIIEYRKLVPAVVPPFMNPTNKIHEIRSAPYSHLSHLFLLVGLW